MRLGLLITKAPALTVNPDDTRLVHIRQPAAMASQRSSAGVRRLSNYHDDDQKSGASPTSNLPAMVDAWSAS
jgi:hypothetical protein